MLEDFKNKYKNILKNEFNDFFDALNSNEEKYIRFNIARGIDYKSEFNDNILIKDEFFDNIFKINDSNYDLINTIGFQTGGFYIQNPSSMFPVQILSEKMPENPIILDLSAAPGGKTTALSELLNRKGLIVANEISPPRMKFLNFNLEKYTAWNVKTICKDGRILYKYFDEVFDGILLDAPCSNENKILKDKKVASVWDNNLINRMQKLQIELIESAFKMLKPGGYLVYSTCTFSIEENEKIIEEILKNPEAEIENINHNKYPKGLSCNSKIDESVIRVMPHKMKYDGFFIACIKKKGELSKNNHKHKFNDKYGIKKYFNHNFDGYISEQKGIFFYESSIDLPFNFKKTGMKLGKDIKNKIDFSTQFIWEFGNSLKNNYKLNLNMNESLEYFKGNDINKILDSKEQFACFYNLLPVGTIKQVEKRLKNKLDRFFLYGRNY